MLLSDVLDGALKLYRANAKALITVSAVFLVPLQVLGALVGKVVVGPAVSDAVERWAADNGQVVRGDVTETVAAVLAGLAILLAMPFVTGAVSVIVSRSYLGGVMEAGEAIAVVRSRWAALAGSWVMVHLLVAVGLAFCILPGLLLLALFVAVPAAIVVEGQRAGGAMGRSWNLVKRRLWPVVGIVLLAWIIDGVIGTALSWVLELPANLMPAGWLVRIAGESAINVLTAPFIAIVAVLIYFDLRIRHEGFDLQVMAGEVARRSGQ